MNKIGIGLDYNNICKDYNTVYLDRDNTDPDTVACMKKVLNWFDVLFSELLETFSYKVYRMNQDTSVDLKEIVKKRFFFYSLEKEILAQTFVFQKEAIAYSLSEWRDNAQDTFMIQNDEEGEGVRFYVEKDSELHTWLLKKLDDCSLDDIPFPDV